MSEGYAGVKINPRHYQRDALRAVWKKWGALSPVTNEPYKKLMIVIPTGGGKTMIFSMLTNHVVKNEGKRTLILAHRDELIRQAQDKLKISTGIDSAIEKASETGHDSFFNVVVGSVQTLCSEKRLKRYPKDYFDYIIVDETHRILADTYQRILNYFGSARVLGVTATPMRGDKQSLGEYFEDVAYEYRLKDAIRDGWLTPIKAQTVPVNIDLTECTQSQGDYAMSGIDSAVTPHLERIADHIIEKAGDRKVLLFLPLVATSKLMAEILSKKGMETRSIDGSMADSTRNANKEWFRDSPVGTALCNSMLLTEGYDQEDINCVVVLRATKSTGLYCQMIGRGTRVLDGRINQEGLTAEERRAIIAASAKPDLLLLDFLWLTSQHRICCPATLVSSSATGEEAGREFVNKGGGAVSLDEVEEVSDSAVKSEERERREAALAEKLDALKGRKAVECDPVVQALSVFDDKIISWEPTSHFEERPISQEQAGRLESFGIKNTDGYSCGFAQKMIDVIDKRKELGLASPKQLAMMRKYGIPKAETKTFGQAKHLIDKLSKSWGSNRGHRRRKVK